MRVRRGPALYAHLKRLVAAGTIIGYIGVILTLQSLSKHGGKITTQSIVGYLAMAIGLALILVEAYEVRQLKKGPP